MSDGGAKRALKRRRWLQTLRGLAAAHSRCRFQRGEGWWSRHGNRSLSESVCVLVCHWRQQLKRTGTRTLQEDQGIALSLQATAKPMGEIQLEVLTNLRRRVGLVLTQTLRRLSEPPLLAIVVANLSLRASSSLASNASSGLPESRTCLKYNLVLGSLQVGRSRSLQTESSHTRSDPAREHL